MKGLSPLPLFADLPPAREGDNVCAAVLPVPLERTTSWGKGTAAGPRSILEASHHLELYDEELDADVSQSGIATLEAVETEGRGLSAALERIGERARESLQHYPFLVSLGGEHSVTPPLVEAALDVHGSLGVIQLDAHADLRDEYEGSRFGHACTMQRVLDLGVPTLAIGLRSLSEPEARLIAERDLPVIWGRDLGRVEELVEPLLAALPPKIYLSVDLDYFDPGILPATGTPEPGGGQWWPTLRLLRRFFGEREVVAADVVELAPLADQPASDFLAAKLVYKLIGYQRAAATLTSSDGSR